MASGGSASKPGRAHAARRFYERHGFTAIAFDGGSGNEEGCPDVRYAWEG
jgi:hypothetical protein